TPATAHTKRPPPRRNVMAAVVRPSVFCTAEHAAVDGAGRPADDQVVGRSWLRLKAGRAA
ncbi:hypothetical protein, partial [Streptomyces sp. NPDC002685]|uniref:hypothetical protein n=1 Tax=Streptomyces sp. NPDC002685 TaxID=3154540 RepID=UPI0033297283